MMRLKIPVNRLNLKISMLVLSILVCSFTQARSCLAPGADRKAQGTFEISDVKPAEAKCLSNNRPAGQSTKAPGCLLTVKRKTSLKPAENQASEFLVYGGDGSCSMKVGDSFTSEISNYCCMDKITGCYDDEPKHSDTMWACTLGAFYKNERDEHKLFPKDWDSGIFEITE
jgi:hypothetical protein